MMQKLSDCIPAFLVLLVFIAALVRKKDAYTAFTRGAGEGLRTAVSVLPYVAAMLVMTSWVSASGLLLVLQKFLSPILNVLGVGEGLTAFALLRPFSGSGALGLLSDICKTYGADSNEAFTAAVMMGSTETLFYTFALYFGAAKVKKTRYAMPVAIICTLAGYWASAWVCRLFL